MLIDEIRNIKSSRRDLRNFGLTFGIILAAIGGLLFWKEKESYPYFIIPGILSIFSGLVFPIILKPIQKVWMTLAVIIGWFMTRVILSILFYLVLTPIGLISRLFGKRFLDIKMNNSKESYWNYRYPKEVESRDYRKQF